MERAKELGLLDSDNIDLAQIQQRRQQRKETGVSQPILCELSLMVGHTKRETRKKYAFKVIWWPLYSKENSGKLSFKFKYKRTEAGLII